MLWKLLTVMSSCDALFETMTNSCSHYSFNLKALLRLSIILSHLTLFFDAKCSFGLFPFFWNRNDTEQHFSLNEIGFVWILIPHQCFQDTHRFQTQWCIEFLRTFIELHTIETSCKHFQCISAHYLTHHRSWYNWS